MDIIHSSSESIKVSLKNGEIVIAVYGLGHVGLAICAVWLNAGATVIGVDVNDELVKSINSGISPVKDEPGIPETVSKYVSASKFKALTNGVEASKASDVKIIAVPTTLNNVKKCDLSAVTKVLQAIAEGLKRGDLVIIESSVPPTTTNNVAKGILEKISKLQVEEDFGLAFSPERIYEGRVLEDINKRYPKVVGGIGPRSTEATASLYETVAEKGVIRTTSATEAETSKLFEGIYRDVNIALANEMTRFCGSLGIDLKEVREAANSQPFCHIHYPGFVGGWCIPFYPHFVLEIAKGKHTEMPLTSLARKINEEKPQLLVKVAESTMKEVAGKRLKGSKVVLLGLTFRGDIADTRNSPSYEVIDLLLKKGVSMITAYDPYVTQDTSLEKKGINLSADMNEVSREADLILVMTDHSVFKNNLTPRELLKTASTEAVLIDGRNILPANHQALATNDFGFMNVEGFHVFLKSTKGLRMS
jgi:UDP-N-acetyl-D-glucosamine dehydrogenase